MRKNKYNINTSEEGKKKRKFEGILFDSQKEMEYYVYLLEQQKQGNIISIERQPKYKLFDGYIRKCDGKKILPIYYILDFKVTYKDSSVKVIDIKGSPPKSDCLMKRKMLESLYPNLDFEWIGYSKKDSDSGWINYDLLVKLRKERKKAKERKKNIEDMFNKYPKSMSKLAE